MTNRRRNLFILLIVAALLGASGVVALSKPTKLGLDLRGGVELIYEAKPTPQQPVVDAEALDRAIDVMRDRVDQLGVAEPEIQRSGETQIAVALPDVEDADEARRQVGQVAQLFFYDWEKNVLGPGCKPDPANPEVTGGPSAGNTGAGSLSLYAAVTRAEDCPPQRGATPGINIDGHFYLVDERQKKVLNEVPAESKEELLEDFNRQPGQRVIEVPAGVVLVRAESPAADDEDADQPQSEQWYVLRDNPALRGTDIKNPEQNFDQGAGGSGQPIVTFDFTSEGRKEWQQVTREIAERGAAQQVPGTDPQTAAQHFAIVLDQELISVPFIDFTQNPTGIDAANGSQIEGGFTIQSAQRLANLLKTGALPVKLELISQSEVSATLGQQSLEQGLAAGAAGFAIVVLFLLGFYRILGAIAVTALFAYAAYLYALVELIPVVLTLPGIAGLVLTLGVAADANIVIFERVKEEIRAGRSPMAGIAAGYKKGLTAIIDANVVTIMVAFILFVLATAGVKGFAFTLGLGVLVSLFTAVVATSAILGTLATRKFMQRPSALGAGEQRHSMRWNFMGASKWFFSMSGVILLIGALAIGGKGVEFGIDFESGTRIRATLEQTANEAQVRALLANQGLDDSEVQRVTDQELGDNVFQISTENLRPEAVTDVTDALDERFGLAEQPNVQSIGPTFGETVANNAIIAIIASLIVISVYIALRFEWKYAVPVLIAVAHDVLIVSGVYSLTDREVTTATVAALLTILGYSLYDTIIVFDRIRENVPRMPTATFSQIVNRSLSEVLVRSLATSFSTLLPVTALMLFGGETLQDFAFALLVGIASGTYSSVFIATPVLWHWKERERVYRGRTARVAAEHGGVVPPYADEADGGDVEPARRRARRDIFAAEAPGQAPQVSSDEWQEMVRDVQATAVEDRPATPPRSAADASPEDVVMPGDGDGAKRREKKRDKDRKPRNRKHGRPR